MLDDDGRLDPPRLWGIVRVRRAYDPPRPDDGARILVDRLWPCGLKKEAARLDLWLRDIAPSNALRTWYGHNEARWIEFEQRYRAELQGELQARLLAELAGRVRAGIVTLLCAAREPERSNAEVLCHVLLEQVRGARRADDSGR
jgi:uncharacterized protein YeaO (DUF488 family)